MRVGQRPRGYNEASPPDRAVAIRSNYRLQLQADRPDVARVIGLRVIEHRHPHAGVAADRDIRMFGIETSRYLEGPLAGAPAGRPLDVRM